MVLDEDHLLECWGSWTPGEKGFHSPVNHEEKGGYLVVTRD